MGKQLSHLTWAELQKEMSLAGSPEKIALLGRTLEGAINFSIDWTNRAEMINAELMLKRLLSEIRANQRRYDETHQITIPDKK